MKQYFLSGVVCSVFVFVLWGVSAHTTQAYFTTSQKTIELDNGAALFLVDYEFGHKNHEIQMPFKIINADSKATDTLSFAIVDKDNGKIPGKASAIIVSNTPLKKGLYSIPAGLQKKFTLIVVFTPSASTTEDYRLQVTNLPFNFDGKQQLQLNPSELKYYTTPYTNL